MTIVPIILAGGTGSRLWPLSRKQFPKQFIRLVSKLSLLQETAIRSSKLDGATAPLIVTGDSHRFLVEDQLQQANVKDASIIIESDSKNTAPAAIAATLHAQKLYGDEALIFFMASDHAINDQDKFQAFVRTAITVAQSGHIATFGVVPTRAETGYGYIKCGAALAQGAHRIASFKEKPTAEVANHYLAAGDYLWNAGMFVTRADVFLTEMQRYQPDTIAAVRESFKKSVRDLNFLRLDPTSFARCQSQSIDVALMEKTDKGAVISFDAEWDDIGSWSHLDRQPKDENGNVKIGDVIVESAKNNLVHASGRLVALCGVDDLIVVDTRDSVLVTTREKAGDVRNIFDGLVSSNRSEAMQHYKVARPWGSYEILSAGPRFQVKRIEVNPGQKLSLQMHYHRAEHWVVVRGTAKVTCEKRDFLLTENESTFIPVGAMHRLENPGTLPLEIIEVQSGGYLGEDDIVRFQS